MGFLVTWVAVRLGITTEIASYFSAILGVSGLLLLTSKSVNVVIGGIILLHLFNLFDCVDGSIARVMKTENPYGKFLDSVIGDAVNFCFFFIVGVMIFQNSRLSVYGLVDPDITPDTWLLIGGSTALSYVLLQHIEDIYDTQLRKSWDNLAGANLHDNAAKDKSREVNRTIDNLKDLSHLFRLIDRNLRVRETHYFILLFAYWLCFVDIFLVFFLIYYSFHAMATSVMFGRRAIILKRQS
ncbi:MAG: hypothetical protein A2Y97_02350 [Nitrospirae bacterium RBG_13_39_12]|nr:MAG: hypothetical protein A2Y97_02350 [Nitrospirae bacterium RBG_13_39_12]